MNPQPVRIVCRIRNRPPKVMHPALVGIWLSLSLLAIAGFAFVAIFP